MFEKKVTCATFINDGRKFLACLPTYGYYYDLPKGIKEKNEDEYDAAVRETYEETSIELDIEKLKRIGRFEYKKEKDLILFSYRMKKLPKIKQLFCISKFNLYKHYKTTYKDYGVMVPEIESYRYVLLKDEEIRKYMKPKLGKIILKAINEIQTLYK